jgi:surface antigen
VRRSRSILTAAAIASLPVAAVVGLLGNSSSVAAAPAAPVSTPVAHAPEVVAHAVAAPQHAVAAKPKATRAAARPTATHHVVAARTVTRRTTTTTTTSTAVKPAPKPTTTQASAPAVRTGNDYPYASATTNANDKWGFTERQCVSFAAWRLARNGHPIDNDTQHWGSAYQWDEAARAQGVRVSSTPHVGAIAQWNVGEGGTVWMNGGKGHFTAGEYGHVGYVAAVYSDGSALIEQYNVQGNREYSVLRMTAPRYLF